MHIVSAEHELAFEVDRVWSVLDDFGAIYRYNPAVRKSDITGGKATGLGAQRICHFYDGTSLKETITDYRPNRSYCFQLSDFALPLKSAFTEISLSPVGSNCCKVRVSLSFVPKFGPLGWLMAKLMMRPMLRKALRGLLVGLEHHMATGKLVGPKGELYVA